MTHTHTFKTSICIQRFFYVCKHVCVCVLVCFLHHTLLSPFLSSWFIMLHHSVCLSDFITLCCLLTCHHFHQHHTLNITSLLTCGTFCIYFCIYDHRLFLMRIKHTQTNTHNVRVHYHLRCVYVHIYIISGCVSVWVLL